MVEPVESFALGKRSQFMVRMASMEEAWSLVREIKGNPIAKFEGIQVWATKSFPAEERARTQSTRRA
eukprot:7881646-Heterocapsa_arctica.AAC.1